VKGGGKRGGIAHRVLETRKTRVVPVIDLAFVIDHREELVVVQSLGAWIAAPVSGEKGVNSE